MTWTGRPLPEQVIIVFGADNSAAADMKNRIITDLRESGCRTHREGEYRFPFSACCGA